MLYFISLYYRTDIFSGANKRFDAMGALLAQQLGDKFKILVCEEEKPDWIEEKNCIFLPKYSTRLQRLTTYIKLSMVLRNLPSGIVVSDFMPIPFWGLKKHRHFQLIYDLRNFTEFSRGGLSFLSARFQAWQLRRSEKIITISEFSKQDIVSNCMIDQNKIMISYCGIEKDFCELLAGGPRTNDVLYVATFEARKNHQTLLQAIDKHLDNISVTFVGQDHGLKDLAEREAAAIAKNKNINFTFIKKISEKELVELYGRTRVYVFPSFVEGFGMPLIEAMAAGCKVACSSIDVFKEVCGEQALYFDPDSPDSIGTALSASLRDGTDQKTGHSVDKFLWSNITEKFLNDIHFK